jgi:hypothetical protein
VGIAATGFCYPGGILQIFHQQDQQVVRLSIVASSQIASTSGRDPLPSSYLAGSSNLTAAITSGWLVIFSYGSRIKKSREFYKIKFWISSASRP